MLYAQLTSLVKDLQLLVIADLFELKNLQSDKHNH